MKTLFKSTLIIFMLVASCHICDAQKDTNILKGQVAIGFNRPLWRGFVPGLNSQNINFPTVNLGLQYMFKPQFGAKLDFGFNRFANADDVPDFKVNYTRFNAQFVYDPTDAIGFLPQRMRLVLHAGPGISFVKPLGNLGDNKQTYLNFLIGTELHYALSETMSIYGDVSYIHGFTSVEDYNPPLSGLGAFNDGILTATIGVTFSISGCYTCN
ncbi:cell envelope biogenesis protein OmpA [Ichthyenterobacterium sp. W332]|uniref:Cell envelope biogenesis protein OmpA n=1 Tax=Microcosmobacter mediterraneus TaxID=3075607 RepID=A0ABU2YLD4_9FLAO|nr:cell envelope biogenesis protein OmpA [Ichthyenterobacterium sp. W332]MDT0558965.1 cell envelope biogenesis protein OmpA [Ichthyenterobacterium sp. W332]